jgi:hypothetical protein
MKTRTRFSIIWTLVILALAILVSMAQAAKMLEVNMTIPTIHWWNVDYVDITGDVGAHASIAFNSNGTPWISYYDVDNTALKVAHYTGSGGNCGQVNDWYCETVDSADSVGTYSSIDVYRSTGFPSILNVGVAYYDATHGALKFAQYGLGSWNIVTVEDAADGMFAPIYGRYASMKYDSNGDAQIAYYKGTILDDSLKYAYQMTSGGNCGVDSAAGKWYCETVDSGADMGQYASLDYHTIAGIAYYDGSAGNLRYAQYAGVGYGNCGTGGAWQCTTVDGTDGDDVGKFASIHFPIDSTDKLQIAYYDATNGELKYAKRADGGSGNCASTSMQCDSIETIGTGLSQAGISLAVDSKNFPIIAYRNNESGSKLEVAQTAYSLGLDYGNCGPMTPFSTWQCTTIDDGGILKTEAEYASIAIDPDGLAMIAYSENVGTISIIWEYNLKIAYQQGPLFLPIVMK